MARCPGRRTHCDLYTSRARNGIKFDPYTYIPFVGLYTEDGYVLRGTEGQANVRPTQIPAPATPTPANCCGLLGIG